MEGRRAGRRHPAVWGCRDGSLISTTQSWPGLPVPPPAFRLRQERQHPRIRLPEDSQGPPVRASFPAGTSQADIGMLVRTVEGATITLSGDNLKRAPTTAAKIREEVLAMSGPEVGDTAVQGREEIADALVRARGRFALDLVEIALHRESGKLGPPPPQSSAWRARPWPGVGASPKG